MSAYVSGNNPRKLYADQLRAVRKEMGYSMGDVAAMLDIPRATYQGYESGRRRMPPGMINRLREWQQMDLEFMAGIGARVDAVENILRPNGIVSEVVHED